MTGSGVWHAQQAWLGHAAQDVLIEVSEGKIRAVTQGVPAPPGAIALSGWTLPGLANVHSHAFQRVLRGRVESGAGDFWQWREEMFRAAAWTPPAYRDHCRHVYREMLEAGITAVGEFHYLHAYGNELGQAVVEAAASEGIRLTLIDACYLRGGLDGSPLEGNQRNFADRDAEAWALRMESMSDSAGVRIAAAVHSVRAVDPRSMRTVAAWARARRAPLHIHLAEQPAEVEACLAFEGCTPAQLLDREGMLGPDLTAIHAIHVMPADIALLGAHSVTVGACPTSERDLGDRVGPLRELAEAGCRLSVGSDSNSVIDMLEEARGIELDQRRATGRRVLHQPGELFAAATVGGMRALGWAGGELKPGAEADFITLKADRVGPIDPAQVVFASSRHDVTNVVVGGRTVVNR